VEAVRGGVKTALKKGGEQFRTLKSLKQPKLANHFSGGAHNADSAGADVPKFRVRPNRKH
jgi:hypothetical protein